MTPNPNPLPGTFANFNDTVLNAASLLVRRSPVLSSAPPPPPPPPLLSSPLLASPILSSPALIILCASRPPLQTNANGNALTQSGSQKRMALADVNGDGILDLAVAFFEEGAFAVSGGKANTNQVKSFFPAFYFHL